MLGRCGYLTAAVAGMALLSGASAAAAGPPPVSEWRALALKMAGPWPAIQRRTGNLPDYFDGLESGGAGTRYGDAMMGFALIQTGVDERKGRLTRAGIRALNYATSAKRHWPRPSVFETMAVAGAYNLARARLVHDRAFRAARPRWADWLRRVRTVRLQYVNRFGNHWLADAISVFELQHSGLHSRIPGAVVGTGGTTARRQAIRLINVRVPRLARGRGPFFLSDPPDYPPAYQALSLALYARAVELLGPRATAGARSTLRRAAHASQHAMAPDGDFAYFGRSQEQSWVPAATAYGAEVAGTLPGNSRTESIVDRALAVRSLARLDDDDVYPVGPQGQWVTPALGVDPRAGVRGVDGYAGGPSMGGLTLALVNWTIAHDEAEPFPRPDAKLPADRNLAVKLSRRAGRFAVVRRGPTWFAVKMTRSRDPHHFDDLRYDFGLVVVKRMTGSGEWFDLVPERPYTHPRHAISAGPVLRWRGAVGYPYGSRLTVTRDGAVSVHGGWRTASGRVLRSGTFRWRPVSCGVSLAWRGRSGDSFVSWALFSGATHPRTFGGTAVNAGQAVTARPVPRWGAPVDQGASGIDPRITRVALRQSTSSARSFSVTWCEAGPRDLHGG